MKTLPRSSHKNLPVFMTGLFLLTLLFAPVSGAGTTDSGSSGTAANPGIWTLDDTINTPWITSIAPSPDGRKIAYTIQIPVRSTTESSFRSVITLSNADGTGMRQLTNDGISCSSPAWSPEGKRIAYISTASGSPQIWLMNSDGSNQYQLTSQETGVVLFSWSPDGNHLSYEALIPPTAEQKQAAERKEDPIIAGENLPHVGLYLVSNPSDIINRGSVRLLTPPTMSVGSWDWSPDGSWIVFTHSPALVEVYAYNTTIARIDMKDGAITELVPEGGHFTYQNVLVSPDGKYIAYSIVRVFNLMDINVIPATGGPSRTVVAGLDQGIVLALGITGWSQDGSMLYVPESNRTMVTVNSIPVDGSGGKELFRYGNINHLKLNGWKTTLTYMAEDTGMAPEIYTTPVNTFSPVQVTHFNLNIPSEKLGSIGKTETVRWTSSDGMEIEGLLTYPANYTKGIRYPLIVEIHGGPSASFLQYFSGGMSWPILPDGTFSSLGYAVLRPNVRGSTGYGSRFAMANARDWGNGDYQDLMTGVDSLVEQGIADPNRVGIIGQSYGGYMAAWAITQTDRFKGAVVIDGITDLISNDGTHDIPYDEPDNLGAEYWDAYSLYTSRSPVYHVKSVKTPTLIVSGQEDARVPIGQAQELYGALWKRGVPVEFVTYPRAGHFPGEPKQMVDLWTREIAWFEKYMPANP